MILQLVVNHFEHNNSITIKSDMIKSLNSYYKSHPEASNNTIVIQIVLRWVSNMSLLLLAKEGYNVFHSIPASYVIVVGVNTEDHRDF